MTKMFHINILLNNPFCSYNIAHGSAYSFSTNRCVHHTRSIRNERWGFIYNSTPYFVHNHLYCSAYITHSLDEKNVWDLILKPHEHSCTNVCVGVSNTNVYYIQTVWNNFGYPTQFLTH